jgi:hypothetical protein
MAVSSQSVHIRFKSWFTPPDSDPKIALWQWSALSLGSHLNLISANESIATRFNSGSQMTPKIGQTIFRAFREPIPKAQTLNLPDPQNQYDQSQLRNEAKSTAASILKSLVSQIELDER